MGNTEWGLLVRSDDDVRYWLQVAKEHNTCENWDEIGEGLIVTCVLNYVSKSRAAKPKVPTGKYMVMMNMGGRTQTWAFLQKRKRAGDVILGMDNKPSNWLDCQDMAWERGEMGLADNSFAIPDIPALFN